MKTRKKVLLYSIILFQPPYITVAPKSSLRVNAAIEAVK